MIFPKLRLLLPLLLMSLLMPVTAQEDDSGAEVIETPVPAGQAEADAAAQAAESADFAGRAQNSISTVGEYLQAGGLLMYPLAALAFLTIALIIFYALTIRRGAVVSDKFMDSADHLLRKEDYLGLLASCTRRGEAIARVCQKAIEFATKNPSSTFAEVREVAEAEGVRQSSLLSQRISYLADIGAIAPMMGLLGTVIGMIQSFEDIATNTMNSGVQHAGFAGGVAMALITTATGLVIGIPALIFYSVYRGRVAKYISELESASTHLVALMGANYHRRQRETRRGGESESA